MDEFPSIEEVNNILDDIAEEIPKPIYKGLNQGIVLLPEEKIHPRSIGESLLIMGQYRRSIAGRGIVIYYGSFKRVYGSLRGEELKEKFRNTLYHEFTHHLESMAGDRDLELEDELEMADYIKMNIAK
ncbi:MAG: metallopeptidase family protein [Andreesenia angusta]|nr:metallopeptidase family protein [Andreesenia angusta]